MIDLTTRYLGLDFRTPLVASSSPLTSDVSLLRELEDHGVAGVVLPSLFEEQITGEAMEIDRMLTTGSESSGEAAGYFPDLDNYNIGPEQYLNLIADAKDTLEIPVIASLNGTSSGGWVESAHLIEEAGADALELNLYGISADPQLSSAEIEARYRELVTAVKSELNIPLAVKLAPYFTALAYTARELVDAGADGLVLFNRFYQPDVDLESLEVQPRLELSTSLEIRLPLRWIGILRGQLDVSLAASSGSHAAEDLIKLLLAGADVTMLASALLKFGASYVSHLEKGLLDWMQDHEYESVIQLRGSVSQQAAADPNAFERANYMKTLRSYSSAFWS